MEAFEPPIQSAVVESVRAASTAPARLDLSRKAKIIYGVGEVSNSIKTFSFGLFLLFFYTSVLGLPGTLVGIATALGLVWDALIDPFIGYASDRSRFRLGRRHAFMLAGAVCMGLSFFAIFSPPPGLSPGALFAWLMVTSLLLRTTNSIFIVPYHALGAELSEDYHERTSITGFRAAFALTGTLASAVSSFVVSFPNTTPGVDPKFNAFGYWSMGLTFGLAMTLAGLLATVGTFSHRSRLQPHPTAARLNFTADLMLAWRHPAFLILTLSASLFFLASVVNATLAIHYLTYYAQITASSALSLFQLAFYVGALVGVAFWLRVAKRVDKQRLYFGATLITALLMAAAYLLVGEGHLFGVGNLAALVTGHAIAGYFASVLWVVPASMIADVTDQDELTTGRRREGTFFGIFSFAQQLAASLAILVTGVLVDRFAGLIPGQVEQSAQTINRLAILFGLLPASLLVVAALLILGYRLTRQRVSVIQSALVERRREAAHGRARLDPEA